jgi:hypothetical protein
VDFAAASGSAFASPTADRIAAVPTRRPSRIDAEDRHVEQTHGVLNSESDAALRPALTSSGRVLDPPLRRSFEASFQRDLSAIRVHDGPVAAWSAAALGARAYAVGRHVVLGDEQAARDPELLAHEIAHALQRPKMPAWGAALPIIPADSPAEREADRAARAALTGRRAHVTSAATAPAVARQTPRPQPQAPPQRQPQAPPQRQPQAPPQAQSQTQPQTWEQQVNAAKQEANVTTRSRLMTALVRQALGNAYTVREAGTSSMGAVDPADYDASPTVNFDVRMEGKTRSGSSRLIGAQTGYFFSRTAGATTTGYAIIGPRALDPRGEVYTRAAADHELFHAAHHARATGSHDDQELEAWTDEFVHYFVATYIGREAWKPLIDYYEGATTAARTAAIQSITRFYNSLSTAAGTGTVTRSERERFETWLRRRLNDATTQNKALMTDLSTALHIAAAPPASAPTSPPAPAPRPPGP